MMKVELLKDINDNLKKGGIVTVPSGLGVKLIKYGGAKLYIETDKTERVTVIKHKDII